jgi:hypothetical protein
VAAPCQDRDAGFRRLADSFFDQAYFPFNPTAGTSAGFHQYDSQLEDYSLDSIHRQVKVLQEFRAKFEQFGRAGLSPDTAADYDLLLSNIRGTLLTLESIRPWERNPDYYSGGVTSSIFTVMSRSFAPPNERLKSVIARERLFPAVFAAAHRNLRNPPRIYTEIALEQLPGITRFFTSDVPAAFSSVTDARMLADFQSSNAAAVETLKSYESWLRADLLPKSHGDFRIGLELYRRKLLYDEMVETPLDHLLEIGYQDLRRNQEAFRRVAAEIDPKRTPQDILRDLERDHPKPADLLDAFRGTLGGVREFIQQHHVVTIPSPVLPILQETPPFMRALTFASMDTPGPFENVAKEAFLNVTLPEAAWPAQRVEEHMAGFNRGTIVSTAIHEAYPGHYVQFLWVQHLSSKVRKLLGAGTNIEGWAHYCEQMLLEAGYGNGDLKLRLGQLQDALLRDARYIVGIRMHTGQMTYEQGIDFFVREGYQSRTNAERETKRGTVDPTYLIYTLGKLEILKLREDYKRMKGSSFTLEDFHDRFLGQGFPPISVVRRALLGNDSPAL